MRILSLLLAAGCVAENPQQMMAIPQDVPDLSVLGDLAMASPVGTHDLAHAAAATNSNCMIAGYNQASAGSFTINSSVDANSQSIAGSFNITFTAGAVTGATQGTFTAPACPGATELPLTAVYCE